MISVMNPKITMIAIVLSINLPIFENELEIVAPDDLFTWMSYTSTLTMFFHSEIKDF